MDKNKEKTRKNSNKKMAFSDCEKRLNSILNLINGWFWEVDLEGNFNYVNVSPKIEKYLGLKPKELIGKSIFELLQDKESQEMKKFWHNLLENPRFFQRVAKYKLPNRQEDIWLESKGLPIFNQAGKLLGFRGIEENITIQKQLEISLAESEKSYQITFEKANIAIVHVSLNGQYLKVNQKMAEMFGYSKEEIITKTWMEMTHPDDLKADLALVEQLLAGKRENYSLTKRYFRKDGSIFWGLLNVSLHREQETKPLYFIATIQDITDRILTEQQLKESKQTLEIITETINDVFWMINWEKHQTIYISKTFEEIWQHPRERLYQNHNTWLDTIHPEDKTRVSKALAEVVNKGIYQEEYRIIRPDGQIRWIEDRGYPIKSAITQDLLIVGCARDISERKIAELTLKESEALHRMVLNSISDTIFLTDLEGNFTFICPNVHFIFEYTAEEVKAMGNIKQLLGDNFYDSQELEVKQEINNIEIIAKDKLHRDHNLLISIKIFPEKPNTILYCARDITETKQTEKEKLALQTRNETLVKTLGEIVYENDIINNTITWNGAVQQVWGYSYTEMGKDKSFWYNRIHPEDKIIIDNILKVNQFPEQFFAIEYRFQHKNGEYIWVSDRGIIEYNLKGDVVKVTGVVADINNRKRIELAIRHIASSITLKSEETFLQSLVKYVAEILPAEVVFISEINPDTIDYATTLVCYHHGKFQNNFSYHLPNTPCQEIIHQQNPNFCLYSHNIQNQYPHNLFLQNINAKTYMGMGLFDTNNKPVGCFVALSSHHIANNSINREIFQIFTSTAAAELERRKVRLQLEEFNQQLEAKVKQRTLELEEAKENAEEKAIALRYLNEIERLLSDISTSLFMIETEKVDEYINDALTAIALFLKVEQISIFQFDKEEKTFTLSHQSQSSIIEEDLTQWHISIRLISWLVNQLQTKWIVMINSIDDFPPIAETERQLFEQLHLKSFVAFPIEFSGNVVGFLTAISVSHHHEWNQGETNLLQLTGKLFSNAIARKKSETALKETQEALYSTNEVLMEEVREREILYNKLQQSETRYRTLFESSHDALSLIDAETQTYIDGNDAAIKIHDCLTKQEFIGKHPADFAPEYQPTGELSATLASRYINEASNTGECFFEWNVRKKDNTIIPCLVSLSAIPSQDNQKNKIILAIVRDISVIKRVQKELEQAKEEADSANKAKSEFLASMSHEIRTPMNAILGFTHIALQNEPSEKQADYLHKIQKACESLLLIINDILDFSKIEAGKLELETHKFFLDNVLTDVANLLNPKTQEKGLELIFDVDNSLDYSLWGDSLRLSQILINLVNNAIKFTDKGQVIVRIRTQEFDNPVILSQGISSSLNPPLISQSSLNPSLIGGEGEKQSSEDNCCEYVILCFCVEDTGIGISREKLSRLFQPFSQADGSITRKYGGTGLGLVISRCLIEMMGGKIWVESEENKGSKFYFTIKLKKGDRACNLIPRSLSSLTFHPILVVDDNSITRKVITHFLESFSFAVKTVTSGLEAIRELEKGKEDYKLIILDWQMPCLNGIDTIQALKANPHIRNIPPILMITAHHIGELQQLSQKYGIKYVLNKPITKSTLFNAILSIFNEKSLPENTNLVTINLYPSFQCFQHCHLLLVEDNEINQEIILELLKEIKIDIANNGLEAIEKISQKQYDAVLMDISMPEMDGLEATKRIRRLEGEYFQKVPIIAMTAHAMTGDRELSLNAGMNAHIIKPINPHQLKETLMQWLPPAKIQSEKDYQSSSMANHNQEEEEEDVFIPSLKGINSEIALSRLMGNKPLYLRLLRQFFSTSNAHKQALIKDAIAHEDYEEARNLIHAVKGVAGNIGAENLFHIAQELESSLKKQERENISLLAEEFSQAFAEVINSLQTLDRELLSSTMTENNPEGKKIDYLAIKQLLREIIQLLEIDLTEAKIKIEQVYLLTRDSEISSEIEEIISYFENFELEEVNKSIKKILSK